MTPQVQKQQENDLDIMQKQTELTDQDILESPDWIAAIRIIEIDREIVELEAEMKRLNTQLLDAGTGVYGQLRDMDDDTKAAMLRFHQSLTNNQRG